MGHWTFASVQTFGAPHKQTQTNKRPLHLLYCPSLPSPLQLNNGHAKGATASPPTRPAAATPTGVGARRLWVLSGAERRRKGFALGLSLGFVLRLGLGLGLFVCGVEWSKASGQLAEFVLLSLPLSFMD